MSHSPEANKSRALTLMGNQNGVKIPDLKTQLVAYDSYCAHLARGKVKQSWWFETKKGVSITWETMENYIKANPTAFSPEKMKIAKAKGLDRWEETIGKQAEAAKKYPNTATLQMKMRNTFGWDRREEKAPEVPPDVKLTFEKVMAQLSFYQNGHVEYSETIEPKESEYDQEQS